MRVYRVNYQDYQDQIVKLQRYLHQYPETAFKEVQTTAFIADYMEKLGYQVDRLKPSGCIARLFQDENYKTVILRAEMDAVPMQELADIPYKSKNDGAMHACGHDGILAVALVLAQLIAADKENCPVNVKFLFEPAEEIGQGSQFMLKNGALNERNVDKFVMFHFVNNRPGMEINSGPASAVIGKISIQIQGRSTHWANTIRGINAMTAAGEVIASMDTLNETYRSRAKKNFIIGLGTIHGGSSASAMAGEITITGNIRSVEKEDYNNLVREIQTQLQVIEQKTGTKILFTANENPVLPIINDARLMREAGRIGQEIWGEEFYWIDTVYLAGDNAYRYFEEVPGILIVFAMPGDPSYSLHNPHFVLDNTYFWKALETLHKFLVNDKGEE